LKEEDAEKVEQYSAVYNALFKKNPMAAFFR